MDLSHGHSALWFISHQELSFPKGNFSDCIHTASRSAKWRKQSLLYDANRGIQEALRELELPVL